SRLAQALVFWRKRIVRVVPLYWIALLWMAKARLVGGTGDADLLRDFFFVPHFHAAHTHEIWPWLVPGWTLGYEMFFYLLFGLAMLSGRHRYALVVGAIVLLVTLGAGSDFTSAAAIFYTRDVMLEFLLGIGVWWWVRQPTAARVPRAVWIAGAIAGFVGLAVDNAGIVRGVADGLPAALIVASVVLAVRDRHIGWLHAVGDASYSTYLFQGFALNVVERALPAAWLSAPTLAHVVAALVLAIVGCTLVGMVVHRLIERPLLGLLGGAPRPVARPAMR
ncbi:MAG: acyltransferase, partial [Burkholderiales bacterium]|nr:acyltransferase [Burkholderiales bacterium]